MLDKAKLALINQINVLQNNCAVGRTGGQY